MLVPLSSLPPGTIYYPESDGEPMSDNTKQFNWILLLASNLKALYRDHQDVFVSGNQHWYPVEGDPDTTAAPDVYVVFGRPKGDRPSYKQWEEGGVPMTVVFEVLSPKNTAWEMVDKLDFYDRYGVEEYYIYDPDHNTLAVYLRGNAALRRVRPVDGFVSPRLGIRFAMTEPEMTVYLPSGEKFRTAEQMEADRQSSRARAEQAEQARDQAEQARGQAEQRFRRLAELSRKARQGRASAEELAELDRLEQSS
jgi:Uma2 family endonuclease